MIKYRIGDDVGALEPWPFDAPESNYVIVSGNPQASGRLDAGGPGHLTRAGIWRCTRGVFECTEQGDELMTILEGRCRITPHSNGQGVDLGPGDSLYVYDGTRVTWEVIEDVTKVFLGFKPASY